MVESFAEILTVGGKSNSLGRSVEVVAAVLDDKNRLEELYKCIFDDDPWVRMRAADSIEKVCRVEPDWLLPYVDRMFEELSTSTQASILWHLAQIFRQVTLSNKQKTFVIDWLKKTLSSNQIDWIVAANSLDTMFYFLQQGQISTDEFSLVAKVQLRHKSPSVVKKANKLIAASSNIKTN